MFTVSRFTPRTQLQDLRLSSDRLATLRTVAAQRQGVVLLIGPPGTGKTLAAEALAGTVGRDLIRVDVGRVVSRYIGETEKNLDRLFATVAASGAVLLLDEADALLGKRSGVNDSHDRFANVEVGVLLQRLESYRGLVILVASRRQNIDHAFLRRLRHVVELPWPPVRS